MLPGHYRAKTCQGREINLWITYIIFWPHKDMERLPGWVISSMPGPPPRLRKHERRYTLSTYSVIPTRRVWNDDYGGQMIFGDLVGLKFPDFCLTGEEKSRKNRGSNPDPLHDRRACYHLFHIGGQTYVCSKTNICWDTDRSFLWSINVISLKTENN